MRLPLAPLAVVAAGLAAACGSSSPETAPAPAAAAPGAAAGPSGPRPAVTVREQYYDIDGASAGALRDQIHRLGPKDESGQSRDALTVWNLEWAYGTAQRGDSCALRDIKVTLDVAVTLPRWKPPAAATSRLLDSWRSYLDHVKLHETGHRVIAERNARELMTALGAMRGTSCEKLASDASRAAEGIVADGRSRNRAYDVETKHGQTQGVVLNP
jgi:predicted secreted Zn-dependent protease